LISNERYIFHIAGGSGDAGAGAASTVTVVSSGRGAARGKRILPADIFVTRPSHVENKKGKQYIIQP